MDIEPLWSLGGWLFLCFFDCMAPASSLSHTYEKPHFPLLLLTLFFVLLLLLNPSTNTIDSSNVTPSIPFKRLLLLHNSSTMDLHPRQRAPSSKSSRREFGAEAHEVPSGPNPISNSMVFVREQCMDFLPPGVETMEGAKRGIWSAGPKWEQHLSEELCDTVKKR